MKAICTDDSSGNALSTQAVGEVLARVCRRRGRPFDLLGFDACLMGMAETFSEIRACAEVAVASEKTEPGDGWPYDAWLARLAAEPAMDGEALGRVIVQAYARSYEGGSQGSSNVTQAAIRLSQSTWKNFDAAVALFSGELLKGLPAHREAILKAAAAAQDFAVRSWFGSYFTTHRDLADFARQIKAALPEERDLATAADLVIEAIEGPGGLVVANGVTDVAPGDSVRRARGVAVYLPTSGYEAAYADMTFAATGWLAFLDALNEGKKTRGGPKSSKTEAFAQLYGAD